MESLEYCPGSAKVLGSIASLYRRQNQLEKAVSYFQRSMDIIVPTGDSLCEQWLFYGFTYMQMMKHEEAVKLIENEVLFLFCFLFVLTFC